jgi:hypothetical protein
MNKQISNMGIYADITTPSTSTTTGALIVSGGAGIGGNVYLGGNIIMTRTNNNSTRFGFQALNANTGSNNTGFGSGALSAASGNNNTAVGASALNATTGSSNTGIGNSAGSNITTGINNTIIGNSAGGANLTINGNITLLGANTSVSANTWSGSTAIGYNSQITASNQIVLGTASESVSIVGTAPSTSTTTGALVVTGGAGISGNVNVGGNLITFANGGGAAVFDHTNREYRFDGGLGIHNSYYLGQNGALTTPVIFSTPFFSQPSGNWTGGQANWVTSNVGGTSWRAWEHRYKTRATAFNITNGAVAFPSPAYIHLTIHSAIGSTATPDFSYGVVNVSGLAANATASIAMTEVASINSGNTFYVYTRLANSATFGGGSLITAGAYNFIGAVFFRQLA